MINSTAGKSLNISAPEWFLDPDFIKWFNYRLGAGLATWQPHAELLKLGNATDSYCDFFVAVDSNLTGEGSDEDMPEKYWDAIIEECKKHFVPKRGDYHIIVRIMPMQQATALLESALL